MLFLARNTRIYLLALVGVLWLPLPTSAGLGMAESSPTLLDTQPPQLELENVPYNLILQAGDTYLFGWTSSDENPGEDSEDFLATIFDQDQTLSVISWYPGIGDQEWTWTAPEVQTTQCRLEVTVRDVMGNATTASTDPFTVLFSTTDVEISDDLPRSPQLGPAIPNPFNPSCRFSFSLNQPGQVEFTVHDLRGRRIKTLHRGPLSAGNHTMRWDGSNETGRPQPGGLYLFVMTVDGPQGRQKMTRQAVLIP